MTFPKLNRSIANIKKYEAPDGTDYFANLYREWIQVAVTASYNYIPKRGSVFHFKSAVISSYADASHLPRQLVLKRPAIITFKLLSSLV